MTEQPVSPVSSWKQKQKTLTLPSGHVVEVFNPGLKSFLVSGSIPNSLMTLADGALKKGQPLEQADIEDLVNDPRKIADMLKMVDTIAMGVVINPKLHPVPENASDRSDDVLYVDEMDDEDKLFIFQWVTGGTSDLERFRSELAGDMAALSPGNDLEEQAG